MHDLGMTVNQYPPAQEALGEREHARIACGTVYIGQVSLLPTDLRALCSCAGLFFARPLRVLGNGDLWVEVAALSRYFSADERTRQQRVRTMLLPAEHCMQLVEYDRRLAARPTSDARNLVEAHAARQRDEHSQSRVLHAHPQAPAFSIPAQQEEASQSPTPLAAPAKEGERRPAHAPEQVMTYTEVATVMVPINVLRTVYARMCRQGPLAQRQIAIALLRAALDMVADTSQDMAIRWVLVLRHRIPAALDIVPIYARGKAGQIVGCRVRVEVPESLAA